ncbi:ATPase [Acinetobacter phage Presley]|uniref:ATPase n=1 Tax=Acinetobacter phage Presley TaxID=1406780 RepID=U5PZV6_9CAUD|nr:ATPase [Acinetobacter phage Presley]AGY48098.1 ATPase [Acinetobacter phage Presley]
MATKNEILVTAIERALFAGLVPHLSGQPGIGKSAIIHALADRLDLKLIDIRLSTMDPTDLGGLPNFVQSTNPLTGETVTRVAHLPNTKFPLQGFDDLPVKLDSKGKPLMQQAYDDKGNPLFEDDGKTKVMEPVTYSGWLIFFDELTSAPTLVKAACYQILLDRVVCGHKLHESVAMVCAGNRQEDGAIASQLGTALENRLITIPVSPDKQSFIDYAAEQNWDIRITSYVNWKPDAITEFKPNHGDINFSSCRTMEFVNDILKESEGEIDAAAKLLIKGALGNGRGTEFLGFCDYYTEIPSIADIVKDPIKTPVPDGLGHQYALAGVLATEMDKNNGKAIIQYASRLGKEFQVVMAGDAAKRNPGLMAIPEFTTWINDNINLLNAEI